MMVEERVGRRRAEIKASRGRRGLRGREGVWGEGAGERWGRK